MRTPEGNVMDYDVICADIRELDERYDIRAIAADRWNVNQIITQLQGDGFNMVQRGQRFALMSAPSRELEWLITGHVVRHGTHPVLTWNVAKVAKQEDAARNIKPSKAKSMQKIDGVVSLIMGIGVASLSRLAEESIYDTQGIRTLR